MKATVPTAPAPSDPVETFFAGAREGILLIQRCTSCGAHQYPLPEAASVHLCRTCAAPRPEWIPSSGSGVIVSFTVLPDHPGSEGERQGAQVAGIVELTEGPWVYAALDMRPEEASVGMPVRVAFREGLEVDRPVPVFHPGDSRITGLMTDRDGEFLMPARSDYVGTR